MRAISVAAPLKRLSKETLNNAALVQYVSGLDPWKEAPRAYSIAYERLGIDLINRVPLEPAPEPVKAPVLRADGYYESPLGIYDTYSRHVYPYEDADELLNGPEVELDYARLITPVPHPVDVEDAIARQVALGETGIYYPMLYTTLFMWGVEWLGWETFMISVMQDVEAFDRKFLVPAYMQTERLVDRLLKCPCPFVVLHDDLADAKGPVFPPWFYNEYIFPRYVELFAHVHEQGKQIIFVADGNMDNFLIDLKRAGADGIMPETPATDLDKVIDVFGDGWIIGGVDTRVLTFGAPDDIFNMVNKVAKRTQGMNRFMISSPGGIHGNIPLDNLIAYFDARAQNGFTRLDWRKDL